MMTYLEKYKIIHFLLLNEVSYHGGVHPFSATFFMMQSPFRHSFCGNTDRYLVCWFVSEIGVDSTQTWSVIAALTVLIAAYLQAF